MARKAIDYSYDTVVTDISSIKAIAEIRDWASIGSLDELKSKIAEAKAALAAAQVSTDGLDVASGGTWMTQAEYDLLAQAIEAAEEQLALAGDNYATTLLNTTPTQSTVDDAIASLSWDAKAGTMDAGDGSQTTNRDALPTTGDNAPVALAIAFAFVAVACGAGAFVVRKRSMRR